MAIETMAATILLPIIHKGVVATVGALPPTGQVVNDHWIVTADGHGRQWQGAWVDIGGAVVAPVNGWPSGHWKYVGGLMVVTVPPKLYRGS